MFTAREVTEDREKLWRVGIYTKIIPFPARQFRKFSGIVRSQLCQTLCAHNCVRHCALTIVCGIVRSQLCTAFYTHNCVRHCALTIVCGIVHSQLCAALCAHNCVRQCALTIVCGIVNCVWQCSMVWYGSKEEVIWKEGGYGLIRTDWLTDALTDKGR